MSGGNFAEARAVAQAFVAARRAAQGLDAYPGTVPATLADAYAIQDAAIELHGGRVAGWKVGRIQPPLDAAFGSDRLAGPIFADQIVTAGPAPAAMPVFGEGFAAVEAEFVVVLRAADPARRDWTLNAAAAQIADVHIGIEIASSPLAAINALGPAVTISDFGNNHGLIVGPAIDNWRAAGLDDWEVAVEIDGAPAGTGRARSFPDGIIGSVRFLLTVLARRGIAVPDGLLVSTGAISGVHQVHVGQSAIARFGAETLTCEFVAAMPQSG
ncbi:2-keto-4-pentenoate hydratase [Glacieibacterium frigidum]|uniref:2-keto-4-pentenoate hydratase n=1 Tax=Glacieibacterium frigidum TaxID=2593303 RepID=A0A552UEU5_9SPHN|nr:2-keto-4-pentenoate hydratase [Glacieibacterium frigidum]TRW16733.1 2-keto-4-pentenoate hydratase [Glacieibacterium frigidum]